MHKNCPIIIAVVGLLILFFGIICSWIVFPKVAEYAIGKQTALVESNEVYNIWKKQPFPLKFKVYFFNVTNPDEVQFGGKPKLKEVGPYVYDEYWERVNITINDEQDTITYMLKRTFYFNEKESACRSENDVVTVINGAIVGTVFQVYLLMPSALQTINDAIPYLYQDAKDIFIRAMVRDILFDGLLITCTDPEVEFVCSVMQTMLPPTIEYDANGKDFKFAMFRYMNTTLKGPFTIGRGLKNTTRGNILLYQNEPTLSVWSGPSCNMINGSDTTLFPTMKSPPDVIYAFSPDICRSMFVSYESNIEFLSISTWKYATSQEVLSNSTSNQCFCPRVKDDDYNEVVKCPKSGLLDITMCVKGPAVVSNPHFYLGDPSLLKYAQGTKPSKQAHENYLYFEPVTGSPVAGAKRLQMNFELKPFEDVTLLNNVSEGVFPMLWIEEGVVIPEGPRAMLIHGLWQLSMLNILKWILVALGLLIMLCSFVFVMYRENLLCFMNGSSNKIFITQTKESLGSPEITTEISFNSTTMYPSLFPQLDEKNVYSRFNSKHNNNNLHAKGNDKFIN